MGVFLKLPSNNKWFSHNTPKEHIIVSYIESHWKETNRFSLISHENDKFHSEKLISMLITMVKISKEAGSPSTSHRD